MMLLGALGPGLGVCDSAQLSHESPPLGQCGPPKQVVGNPRLLQRSELTHPIGTRPNQLGGLNGGGEIHKQGSPNVLETQNCFEMIRDLQNWGALERGDSGRIGLGSDLPDSKWS